MLGNLSAIPSIYINCSTGTFKYVFLTSFLTIPETQGHQNILEAQYFVIFLMQLWPVVHVQKVRSDF